MTDRVKRAALMRELPTYSLGRQHVRLGVSDFHRRALQGPEREAYMLGRFEQAADRMRAK